MPNSEIIPFTFEEVEVRAIEIDGVPWFVAADIATILGYRMASDLVRTLDIEEKGTHLVRTPGGDQVLTLINEGGLFKAIVQRQTGHIKNASVQAKVKSFQRWVTHEVLPEIRRTGGYNAKPELDATTPEGAALVLQAALTFQAQVHELTAKVAEDAPKVEAYDRFLNSTSLIKIEVAARRAGIGRTTAYRLLRDAHIIQRWNKSPMRDHAHRFVEVPSTHENSSGDIITDYTTKVRPEHFEWLVDTLSTLAGTNRSAS